MRTWFLILGALVFCMPQIARADAPVAEAAEDENGYAQDLEESLKALSDDLSDEPAEPGLTQAVEEAAQDRPSEIVDIEVRGNQIVSTSTILSKIRLRKGSPLIQKTVNDDIKRLYATGFFEDIQIEAEERTNGYKLLVMVVEKALVREVVISGNSVFDDEKIRKELKIIEGQILDRKAIKEGVERVRAMYNNKGFRFVDIQSDVDINRQTKEATINIRVEEGAKYRINEVKFEGVQSFKDKKLRKLMKTRPRQLILLRTGVFKEDNFDKDLERIRLFYQQEGYLDVRVVPSFDYDRENQKMAITITVEEGKHYVTGDIKIQGNRLFPESEIWQQLEMLPGQTYSQFYLSKDIEKIRDYYHERGYVDARIVPDVQLNRGTGKVDLVYQLQEGDLYFVEKVLVRGNTKTKDIVIRRELRIRPGERFDGERIRKSKQRLENLGYFEEVTYDTEPASESNRKDLIFRVKEKRTGELSFGGGVSSVDRFVGFAEISQRNFDLFNFPRFTGGGQSLSVRARVGSISQNYEVSFVEPYLFNKPVSFGTDVFSIHREDRNVDFEQERRGFSVTFSRLFRDIFRLGTGYTLENVELDEISDDAPRTVRDFAGDNLLSRWKIFNSIDTRDNVFRPTKGMLISTSGELVGSFLGGDEDFYVLQASASQYWSLFKQHVLEASIRLGASQDFGDSTEVPVFDRFYAGGLGTVRGYNFRRVGPIEAGDAIGGQTLAIANLEYTFPLPYLEAFHGAFFIDVGHVNPDSYKVDFGEFAVSIGPGIKIRTPIGPVAFYYGFPIANRDTEDRNGRFEFSLSRGF